MQPFVLPGAQEKQQMPTFGAQMIHSPQVMVPVPMMMVPCSMFTQTNMIGTALMCNNLNLMDPNSIDAAGKVNRELFVGNTPSDTSESVLVEFLNGAMQRARLCEKGRKPIIKCRLSTKFAFIECETAEDASRALNLNGIRYKGMSLRVSRPSKYAGPNTPCKTWQEHTCQHLTAPPIPDDNERDADKVNREIYIRNITPEMTESGLIELVGEAMEYVDLTKAPGSPIVSCQINGKFAVAEFRSDNEASAALNLNHIPFMGSQLRFDRHSEYAGPVIARKTWDEVLSRHMSQKLQSNKGKPREVKQTRIVQLKNMLTVDDLESEEDYREIMDETREECGQFGDLKRVVIPRRGVGATKILLEYKTTEDAAKAIKALAGRTFDGRTIEAVYADEEKYLNNDYSG